jgi:hypothetical protein
MARSKETGKSSKSSFANLKTFNVTSTFLVAERTGIENLRARNYVMCIGYGKVGSLPIENPRIKAITTKQ